VRVGHSNCSYVNCSYEFLTSSDFSTNYFINYIKVNFTLEQAIKAQRRSIVIALLFFYLGARWSVTFPGCFTPRKETQYPLYRRLGGPQGRSGRLRKNSPPLGFDPRTVQPEASLYTDCAIPAHSSIMYLIHFLWLGYYLLMPLSWPFSPRFAY
jgi:hypothetical protein